MENQKPSDQQFDTVANSQFNQPLGGGSLPPQVQKETKEVNLLDDDVQPV